MQISSHLIEYKYSISDMFTKGKGWASPYKLSWDGGPITLCLHSSSSCPPQGPALVVISDILSWDPQALLNTPSETLTHTIETRESIVPGRTHLNPSWDYNQSWAQGHKFNSTLYASHCCYRCCHSFGKSWPTLCDPMACSVPGFPVLHLLPELHISLSLYKRSSGERDDFSSRITHQIHFFSEPPFKNDALTQCVLKERVSVRAGLELNLPFLLMASGL